MFVCFRTVSPLGPCEQHTPDPYASNVNKPAFPERKGGPDVKVWRESVKYRDIRQENSNHTTFLFFFHFLKRV